MNNFINFGLLKFPRNGVLASGILGLTGASMVKAGKSGAGGVTSKSISKNIRKGHPAPVIQAFESGLINAVGLSSTGVENMNEELRIARKNTDAVMIASVFGGTVEEFCETIELLDMDNIDAVELNISCPNVHDEFGLPFAASSELSGRLVREVRRICKLPLLVKLSPNFHNLCETAKACEFNGADGITAINTVGPGMLIDINTFKPRLSNNRGGVSGPAILPVAVRCVFDIFKSVKIPILGIGGVRSVEHALQLIIAGATLYGVGTGILYEGLEIFNKVNEGIDAFLTTKNISYPDLIGIVHKE